MNDVPETNPTTYDHIDPLENDPFVIAPPAGHPDAEMCTPEETAAWEAAQEPLRERVRGAAREDAILFVDEFHEPLDSSQTDWDAEAWRISLGDGDLRDVADQINEPARYAELWPLYVRTLEAETARLCEESTS